jgi:hypothetical protein
LFEYFKNLNEPPIENDKAFSFPNIDPFDLNCVNENLNKKIAQKEILEWFADVRLFLNFRFLFLKFFLAN